LVKKTKTPPLSEPLSGEPSTKIKIFFLNEPRRLAASVEGLNNSLATAAGELCGWRVAIAAGELCGWRVTTAAGEL